MHSYIPPSNQMVYINEYSVYSSHMQKNTLLKSTVRKMRGAQEIWKKPRFLHL